MKKYSIVNKQIPTDNFQDYPIPTENIIFNEEIKLNKNNIRIRIIIQDLRNVYNVFSYQYEKYAGLSLWNLDVYKNIDDLINKVFIYHTFKDRGISIATGVLPDTEETELTI